MTFHNNSIPTPLRILFIEDSEDDVTAFKRVLAKGGLETEITHFTRAEDALPSLDKVPLPYDLVVADYKLPGMTGLELCKHIIDMGIPLPCVMVTGAGTENIAVEALKAGVIDYLVKDYQQNYLEILPLFLPEVVRKHRDRQAVRIFRREREVIAAIAEMFLAPENVETLCRTLPETLAKGFAFPVSAVLLLAENKKELIVKGISGLADKTLLEKRIEIEQTTCHQTIIKGLPVLRLDVAANPELHCLLKDSGIDTCLSVPIKGKSLGVMGALVLADFKKRPDAKIHISAMQDIAHHLGQEIERKQVEDELRLHSEIINNLAEGILLVQANTLQIVYANPVIETMFAYEPGELLGKHVSILNDPSKRSPKETAAMIVAVLSDKGFWQGKIANIKKNGTPFWCKTTISGFEHHQFGKVWVSIRTDITDKMRLQDALVESHKEWTLTFDAMADIVTIQDKNMRIVRANQAAHRFFQTKYGELNGKHCYKVFRGTAEPCPGCPLSDTIEDINHHSEIMTHENLGKIFHVSSAVIPTANGEIQYLVHIAKDITEQKHLEEELYQSHKMEAIGTLAGGIAHDFNNILTAILGYAGFVKENLPAGCEADKDIDEVIKGGQRAADLVRQILAFSRKGVQNIQSLKPHLIIKEAVKMMRSSLPATIRIEEDIDSECGEIKADPTQIHQIVINLCTNAFQAMENEKGILRVKLQRQEITSQEITEADVSAGPFIVLSISDTGCGMSPTTIERIFEPYFTTKDVGKGSGLGLAVVHGIVKRYHGFIRVESAPGEGASFHIYIPALKKDMVALAKVIQQEPLPTGRERILVVDDEGMIVRLNKALFERLGYAVTATTDSREALELIRRHPNQFDLIVTDQSMPNLSGAELAREVLKIKSTIPIILCTGYSSAVSEKEALAIGIKKYVFKPVDLTTLAQIIRQVLDENRDKN